MSGGLIATLASASLIAATLQAAPVQGAAPAGSGHDKHVLGDGGRALTERVGKTGLATVRGFLREQRLDPRTVRSLRPVGATWTYRGVVHQRYEQRVQGLRVYGGEAKASFNSRRQLVHLIQFVAPVRSGVRAADVGPRAALRAVAKDLYPARTIGIRQTGSTRTTTTYDKGRFFLTRPTVERIALPARGGFTTGYLVTTWDERSNKLYASVVSGKGRVRAHELRTANDSYNVFREDPDKAPQQVVAGPGNGDGTDVSPVGWLLSVAQTSTNITGNNVHAYLDSVPDNKPDAGGDPVKDGNFLTGANLAQPPTTEDNREVAVQNLFYLNNVIHDALYAAGFTEAAGNFQEDNFGAKGGSDSVDAEAQDGGGIDNANFATPPDGVNPRMQMYLWTGLGTHQVLIGADSWLAQGAQWGAALTTTGVTGVLALAADGTAPVNNACEPLTGTYTGQIVIADRGACDFTVKAKNVQAAGGIGLIVANNNGSAPFTMGGADSSVTIPAVMVSQEAGAAIKAKVGQSTTIRLNPTQPLQRDGDLDADIVYHEYGHGLTWRMIGKMSGTLAGAIGEGMADVLAIVMNGDDRIGEYSASDPFGIRSMPYDAYNRTYGDVVGEGVHFDGEVYGAIGWRLLQHYQAAGIDKSVLLADLVDGMNYTPREPAFEDMRDGILTGLSLSDDAGADDRACMVWDAFAEYGVGVGADGVDKGKRAIVTESMELPDACEAG